MPKRIAISVCLAMCSYFVQSQATTPFPAGDIRGPFVFKSKIYPGTERNYWVYVPKQYNAEQAACTMILQDGLSCANNWRLPTVLDSLINLKAIPVIIGIFIDHGKVPAAGSNNYPRYNRSFEYDAMGDRYARFLLEEILPEVSRTYHLSTNPNDRSIAGASSGAICAFNAAWERPDAFRRVFSCIGTYVGLRGADEFATLVRKTEPKPLRVFLQDGDHDLNIYAGDWWMANQGMLSALTWAGYEVNHAWGTGGHDSRHTTTILADALTWLWKDYPAPVTAHNGSMRRMNPLIDNEPWQQITTDKVQADKLAAGFDGRLFFSSGSSVYSVTDAGKVSLYKKTGSTVSGICIADENVLFAAATTAHKIISIDNNGTTKDIVLGVDATFMTATDKGIYFSDNIKKCVGFYSLKSKKVQYISTNGLLPTGLAVSADQTFLDVGVSNDPFGYSFQIKDDGSLDHGQAYIHYHIPYGLTTAQAGGMAVDTANLLYTATAMGIQVTDQLGRVNYIFSKPAEGASDVKLSGFGNAVLYVNCRGTLYKRRINTQGVQPYFSPVKPPRPGL